ncbi:hypothetical protein [uncultured Marinobacter sp.]|uniref:hypothetical protein n=1 Tax=uncultured Marinobacter sp. TaxID=187379 RepID=UPI0025904676|nr:hypothetical protein [uncultured Marinobacter sp.]
MTDENKRRIRRAKALAEKAVDRVITMMASSDRDAGWDGTHPLGAFHNFQGHRPERSGFSAVDRAWEKTVVLNDWPEDFLKARDLLQSLRGSQQRAVLYDRLFRGYTRRVAKDPFHPDKTVHIRWTDAMIAQEMGITEAAFRQRVSRGYRSLILKLDPGLITQAG